MRTKKYIGYMMVAATLSAAVSCSDYSDWNTVENLTTETGQSAEQTLWESLTEREDLSDFVQVLKKADLSETLSAARFYTVWAPVNGSFDLDSVLACPDDIILSQFINNHIAEYNHLATGTELAERVRTLNKKSYDFKYADGVYSYNDVPLALSASGTPLYNLPCSNGTLHIINGNSEFLPNGFEALTMIDGVSRISSYIMNYNDTTLDTRNSVAGSIVNGKQTYLDSVFTISNTMTRQLRASIDSEDSTYSVLLPTDEAYEAYYQTVRPFYNYFDGIRWQNVAEAAASTFEERTITASVVGVDFSYLADSLAKRSLVNNLFYSNNNPYNMHLAKADAVNYNDTVVSTSRNKFSNGDELFDPAHIVQKEHLSNGYAYVVDTLTFKPWETYNAPITISGTSPCRTLTTQSYYNQRLSEENTNLALVTPEPGELVSFCVAEATTRGKPEVDFYLSGVKATTYNVYCVIPPANVDLRDSITEVKPNILNFTYQGYYVDEAGRTQYTGNNAGISFTNERYDGESLVQGATRATLLQATDFVNDTSKVDTLYLGQLTFPYCYAGLGYYPNIKVTSSARINVLQAGILNNYTRDIRICAILLRPLDYEAYLEEEKQTPNGDE